MVAADQTGGESGDELQDSKVVENNTSQASTPVITAPATSSNVSGNAKVYDSCSHYFLICVLFLNVCSCDLSFEEVK